MGNVFRNKWQYNLFVISARIPSVSHKNGKIIVIVFYFYGIVILEHSYSPIKSLESLGGVSNK